MPHRSDSASQPRAEQLALTTPSGHYEHRKSINSKGRVLLQIIPLTAIGEIEAGDDLAAILSEAVRIADLELGTQDVIVVTQKIVSKAEGRIIGLSSLKPSERAHELAGVTGKDPRLVELVLAESSAVIRAAPKVLITRHRTGHVMANAGIDRSNIGPDRDDCVLLLPEDADASAARLRDRLNELLGVAPAVLVSDSFGRPWRMGVVNVVLGAAGLPALIDRRGDEDRDGRTLEVTEIAFGDMIASAAGLVAGEAAEGIPAAVVRGLTWEAPDRPAKDLLRSEKMDLFR